MLGMKWNQFCTWILHLIILNFLWLGTIILGFVIFGIGPASYAVSATIRQWVKIDESSTPVKTYMANLRQNLKENIISGIMITLFIMIVTVDLLFVKNWGLRVGIFLAIFVASPVILLYYPVSAHFNVKNIKEKIHLIFQLFLRYSLLFIVMCIALAAYGAVMLRWLPAYFILIGYSSIQWIIMMFLKNIYIKEQVWDVSQEEADILLDETAEQALDKN
ncbi:YesL family protein [Tuanshanicoccus lijuaniae]|uniref:YesL family protein n=1 Tax=Aerococcaceae bacterium zg-1292 TaxID=2774330 RepID=UPI004063824C